MIANTSKRPTVQSLVSKGKGNLLKTNIKINLYSTMIATMCIHMVVPSADR